MTTESFTSQDEGLVPVEVEGAYFHLRCAQEMGLTDRWLAWHGGKETFATYAMDSNPVRDEHEFCCQGCLELFPFVNTGRWL